MQVKGLEKRKQLLVQQIHMAIAAGGRIESQSDKIAIVVTRKPVNHVLHLILTLVTGGLWAIVWVILAISGGEKRQMISIDEYANVLIQKV